MNRRGRRQKQPVTFTLVGAGRLGLPLGRALSRNPGFRLVGTACRSAESARRAARRLGRGRAYRSVAEAAENGGLVLICVPDRNIRKVAERLAAAGSWTGRTVLHCSGALDASELRALARRGARTGSIHPLQTFAGGPGDGRRFRNCVFAIEGEPSAVRVARSVAGALGGRAVTLAARDKIAYHLCACLLSNYLVSLVSFGQELFPGRSPSHRAWMRQFGPLMRATLDNLERTRPERILTGPISRGDNETLTRHLKRLRRGPRDLRALHDILALRAIDLAISAHRIDTITGKQLKKLLV
jgi:predicted short-subunit dehydrogenase-like oxidoreductase (DUF2520 family)